MKAAIYSRGTDRELKEELQLLINEFDKNDIEVILHFSLAKLVHSKQHSCRFFSTTEELDETVNFLISLGGDGTILDTVTLIKNKNIPILGINYGRLGFLASIGRNELVTAVQALVKGNYSVDERTLVHLDSNKNLFGESPFGLNEFSIHKRDIAPMIKINTYLNNDFLNTYWCDGLIVATPTGSTGYNMSCNGPIVFPEASNFVITPVAPHNLSVRPIIVPDSYTISFKIESRSDKFICAMDARKEIVSMDTELIVKKENFKIGLIKLNDTNFLSTLHNKLTWGIDKRN